MEKKMNKPRKKPKTSVAIEAKCINLTIEERMQVLKQLEAGLSQRQVASSHNISKSTVSNIQKRRADIEQMWEEGYDTNKRIGFRRTSNEAINQEVLSFYQKYHKANVLLTGPILKMKALDIAKKLGKTGFQASNGWLDCFLNRYNVQLKGSRDKTNQTMTAQNKMIETIKIKKSKTKQPKALANNNETLETLNNELNEHLDSEENISVFEALLITQRLLNYGHRKVPEIVPMVLKIAETIQAQHNRQQ